MNRVETIEAIAEQFEEPSRALLRASLVAQRHGRLDAAARVTADELRKHPALPGLPLAALLLALEAAELRLGGAVCLGIPSETCPIDHVFSDFGIKVYPSSTEARLELVLSGAQAFSLIARRVDSPTFTPEVCTAAEQVAVEIERHFGMPVSLRLE